MKMEQLLVPQEVLEDGADAVLCTAGETIN